MQLKFPPTTSGPPSKDSNDLQLEQPKSPPTTLGEPSRDSKDAQ